MQIEWHIEKRNIKNLKDYFKNPRKITKRQIDHLKHCICKFGLIDKPFINTDNTIIGGHQRIRILKKLGYDEIEVNVPDRLLTEKEVEELNIRHNNNTGSNDDEILANQFDMDELSEWGFTDDYFQGTEPEPRSGSQKGKATFEFTSKEELEECLFGPDGIEEAASKWGAKLKIK